MGGGRRVHAEHERNARRRWRPGLDEAGVSAAVETFRRNWPAFDEWWAQVTAGLGPGEREVPPEPMEAAIRTYLERAGL